MAGGIQLSRYLPCGASRLSRLSLRAVRLRAACTCCVRACVCAAEHVSEWRQLTLVYRRREAAVQLDGQAGGAPTDRHAATDGRRAAPAGY